MKKVKKNIKKKGKVTNNTQIFRFTYKGKRVYIKAKNAAEALKQFNSLYK